MSKNRGAGNKRRKSSRGRGSSSGVTGELFPGVVLPLRLSRDKRRLGNSRKKKLGVKVRARGEDA